jgi:hypothetical protein
MLDTKTITRLILFNTHNLILAGADQKRAGHHLLVQIAGDVLLRVECGVFAEPLMAAQDRLVPPHDVPGVGADEKTDLTRPPVLVPKVYTWQRRDIEVHS